MTLISPYKKRVSCIIVEPNGNKTTNEIEEVVDLWIFLDLKMTGTEKRDWKGYTLILVRMDSFLIDFDKNFFSHRFVIVMWDN